MEAKILQKILWHIRWIIGVIGIINAIYFLFDYHTYPYEIFTGISVLLLFFYVVFNQLEKYVECISSCPIQYGKEEKK